MSDSVDLFISVLGVTRDVAKVISTLFFKIPSSIIHGVGVGDHQTMTSMRCT